MTDEQPRLKSANPKIIEVRAEKGPYWEMKLEHVVEHEQGEGKQLERAFLVHWNSND